jgi:hypothetical protein
MRIHTTTRLGIMPRHCSADSPPLCDTVRRGQQPPCGTIPLTPVRAAHRTLEKGRRNPRRDDARLLCARTGRRRDVRPAGGVTSVAISPVRPSPPSQRHPGHCITIPDAVEHAAIGHCHADHCALYGLMSTAPSPHGRPPNEQPQRHPPRGRSWRRARHAVTPRQKRDSPGQLSTP